MPLGVVQMSGGCRTCERMVVSPAASAPGESTVGHWGQRTPRLLQLAPTLERAILCPAQGALIAQLDRASDYGSEGWGFESLSARHLDSIT